MAARRTVRFLRRVLLIVLCLPRAAVGQERNDTTAPQVPSPTSVVPSEPGPTPIAPPPVLELPDQPKSGDGVVSPFTLDVGPFGAGNPRVFRPSIYRADYRVTWVPEEPVQGQSTSLGLVREDFAATVPIWHDERNDFAFTTHVRNELFQGSAIIPNTGQPFPEELWMVRLGGSYRHLFENDWIGGANVSLGSSGDHPFASTRDVSAGVNAFLTIPQGERNAWLFTLNYSTNSELAIPIPGVAYVWQPTDNFRMNVGLPFQLMYRPMDDLTFDFSYMLLRTVHARATYRVTPRVRIYAGYDWGNEAYPLADRPSEKDRLYYYDQRVSSGVRFDLGHQMALDLSGGYTFDRFYFEGQHYADRTNNSIVVGDAPLLSLQFLTRW